MEFLLCLILEKFCLQAFGMTMSVYQCIVIADDGSLLRSRPSPFYAFSRLEFDYSMILFIEYLVLMKNKIVKL